MLYCYIGYCFRMLQHHGQRQLTYSLTTTSFWDMDNTGTTKLWTMKLFKLMDSTVNCITHTSSAPHIGIKHPQPVWMKAQQMNPKSIFAAATSWHLNKLEHTRWPKPSSQFNHWFQYVNDSYKQKIDVILQTKKGLFKILMVSYTKN